MSKIQSGCNSDCMNCADTGCTHRLYDEKAGSNKINEAESDKTENMTKEDEKNG